MAHDMHGGADDGLPPLIDLHLEWARASKLERAIDQMALRLESAAAREVYAAYVARHGVFEGHDAAYWRRAASRRFRALQRLTKALGDLARAPYEQAVNR